MICTVLQHKNAEQIWEALDNCEMAEIRLDLCELTLPEIEELFSSDVPLVATCRISQNMSPQMAERRLIKAVEAGSRRVLRGGGYFNGEYSCRSANRSYQGPTYRGLSGLRLAY